MTIAATDTVVRTRACLLEAKDTPLVFREIGLKPPGQREVLVRMTGAGLCRSDLNGITGHTRYNMPLVLGHEGVGVVEECGPGAGLVKKGDRVILLTDGVFDAKDREGRRLGFEDIVSFVKNHMHEKQLVNTIVDYVNDFSSGTERADDLTLVELRWGD